MSRIVDWVNDLPAPVRAALRTFAQVFAGIFLVALVGWLDDVIRWANEGSEFPNPDVLAKALVSGAAAGISAVVTWAHNWAEERGLVRPRLKGPSMRGRRVDGERYVA